MRSLKLTVCLVVLAAAGCHRTYPGAVIGSQRVLGSERLLWERNHLQLQSMYSDVTSSIDGARLVFRVSGERAIAFELETRHQLVRVESKGGKLAASAFWLGVGGVGIVAAERTRDLEGDSLTTAGKWYGTGAVVSIVLGLTYLVDGMTPSPPEILEGVSLPGVRSADQAIEDLGGRPGTRISVSGLGMSRAYATDNSGLASVGLRQFGATYFERPDTIEFAATIIGSADTLSTRVPVQDVLEPCVRMIGRGLVFPIPNATGEAVATFEEDQVFALVANSNPDYFGVSVGSTTGWVPRLAAVACWRTIGR